MKRYSLALLVCLTGCEETNLNKSSPEHTQVLLENSYIAPTQQALNSTPLLAQHMQENTTVYPRNSAQLAIDQSIKAITATVQQDVMDIMGGDLQSVDTNFNGERITFQYQVWQIKKTSVCSHVQQNALQFSNCTQAAKQLFQSLCSQLQIAKQNLHPRAQQLQRMYCQAAIDFKPMMAQISRSSVSVDSKNQVLRKACNDLIFKAKISGNIKDEKARDQACQIYKKSSNSK